MVHAFVCAQACAHACMFGVGGCGVSGVCVRASMVVAHHVAVGFVSVDTLVFARNMRRCGKHKGNFRGSCTSR